MSRLEGSDDRLYDLLDPFEPVPLPPLAAVEQRRALLAGVMAEWCRRNGKPVVAPPPAGGDPHFDRRLADPRLPAAEPLYLLMAGLVAARHGLATLLSLGRLDLALELACWERDRLVRLAGHRDVNDKLLLHLVACATLCRGVERGGLRALIDEERAALPYERGVERDALAQALEAGLPAQAEAGAPQFGGLQPDIVGETFCLLVLATNPDLDQAALVDRCRERAPARTAQHLVLTVQDFARPAAELTTGTLPARRPEARLLPGWLGEDGPALAWLDHLVAGTDDLVRLMAIADQMPEHTLLLRERAMLISHRIADVLRPFARIAADDEIGAVLASTLNNLANRLSDLGRREEALAAAEEAVAIRRELAAARPDAFRHNLALSLAVLANCLDAAERPAEALTANQEAIERLREPFLALPPAFVHWMLPLVRQYIERCTAQGVEPDGALLEPILPVLMAMIRQGQEAREQGEQA